MSVLQLSQEINVVKEEKSVQLIVDKLVECMSRWVSIGYRIEFN